MSTTSTAPPPKALEPHPPRLPVSRKASVSLTLFALLALVVFGLLAPSGVSSTFALSLPGDETQLSPVTLPSQATGLALSVVLLALAAFSWARTVARRSTPAWVSILFGAVWMFAFLVWAVADKSMSLTGLLQGSLLLAVPLVFGSLSGVLCERAGVINIAIEGHLLAGAFLSAVVASLTNNLWAGLLAAPLAGLLVAMLLALFTIKYFVDQIIVGVVLNVLVIGVTGFLYGRLLVPYQDTWNSPGTFAPYKIPLLGDIPVLGPVLFNQSVIVYLMYVVVVVVHIALFKTRYGLRVRAVGEHPAAADTVGIRVNFVRARNVLIGGLVAGLGGAFFTLGSVGAFGKEMTAGKGFIALAAMIFGRWTPLGALAAALLFGFADNLQSVLSIIGTPIPSEFMLMAPYLATIFAVAGLVGRVRAPAADGKPYIKS
ncbi:MAG: ABC transporter permease [Jiangellales bacterium]